MIKINSQEQVDISKAKSPQMDERSGAKKGVNSRKKGLRAIFQRRQNRRRAPSPPSQSNKNHDIPLPDDVSLASTVCMNSISSSKPSSQLSSTSERYVPATTDGDCSTTPVFVLGPEGATIGCSKRDKDNQNDLAARCFKPGVMSVDDYGYGDSTPSIESTAGEDFGQYDRSKRDEANQNDPMRCFKPGVMSAEDYGYDNSTSEESTVKENCGYGRSMRDEGNGNELAKCFKPGVMSVEEYGYGESSPSKQSSVEEDYGYGSTEERVPSSPRATTMHRRSSMRQPNMPRRNSITPKGEIEITLRPSQKGHVHQRVRRRTSLTFQETAQVTTIESKNDIDNKAELWFQPDEMSTIRKKVSALVMKTEGGNSADGTKYCIRGLERHIDPESCMIKRNLAWDAVLQEQYLQEKEGIFQDDHIANLYKFSTLRSQNDAVTRAQEDEKEIAKYLKNTRRMCRRMSM